MILVTCTNCDRSDVLTIEERREMIYDAGMCNKCHLGFTRSKDIADCIEILEEF